MYKCYICGKEHNTPLAAAECTYKCNDKLEHEKELRKQELQEKKLKELRSEITTTFIGLRAFCEQYCELDPDINLEVCLKAVPKKVKGTPEEEKETINIGLSRAQLLGFFGNFLDFSDDYNI